MASTSSPTTAYRAQNGIAETGSYDPQVVDWIKQAAAATGADPAALLATSLQEAGAQRGRVGDQGTSYGPFQFHEGGALGSHNAAWANSYPAVLNRAQEFSRLKVRGGTGAAAVQRPRDPALYARGVDALLARANAILGHHTASVATRVSGRKSTPAAPPTIQVDDSADTGPMIMQALQSLHANARLPGANLPAAASPQQFALNSLGALAGVPVPTLPGATAASTTGVFPASGKSTPPGVPKAPLSAGLPTLTPGGGWGGSHALAQHFANLGRSMGLSIASEKRNRKMTASGGVSDHWTGSKTAYAYDMSNGSRPTPQMDRFAAAVAAQLGVKGWKGGVLNVNRGGYRYQVLYRTNVGGNHFNHVHVGVRKL